MALAIWSWGAFAAFRAITVFIDSLILFARSVMLLLVFVLSAGSSTSSMESSPSSVEVVGMVGWLDWLLVVARLGVRMGVGVGSGVRMGVGVGSGVRMGVGVGVGGGDGWS